MAEAVGIDKDKPKEAVTVAVKMLKGKRRSGGGGESGEAYQECSFYGMWTLSWQGVREHIVDREAEEFSG